MQLKFHLFVLTLVICLSGSSCPAHASNVVDTKAVVARGAQLIEAQKYSEAVEVFSRAASKKPKNSVLQYYLGMACIYAKNTRAAESALSKAIAVTGKIESKHTEEAETH